MKLRSGATLRRDLGEAAFEALLSSFGQGYLANELMPIKQVPLRSSAYPKIEIETFLKTLDLKRAPKGAYARDEWDFTTGEYTCEEYGFEGVLDDVEFELYSSFIEGDMIATLRAADKVIRAREIRVANLLLNTTIIPETLGATAVMSDKGAATPRADVIALKLQMRNNRGVEPDVCVMSHNIFLEAIETDDFRNSFTATSPIEGMQMDEQLRLLATYLTVPRVLIGKTQVDTAKKGKTATLSDVWSNVKYGLYKIAKGNDLAQPAIGRSFLWTEDSPTELVTEQYREEKIRSDIFRVRQHIDEAIVWAGAGAIMTGV